MSNLLDIKKMSVSFQTEYETTDAVRDVSITLRPGEVLGIVCLLYTSDAADE